MACIIPLVKRVDFGERRFERGAGLRDDGEVLGA